MLSLSPYLVRLSMAHDLYAPPMVVPLTHLGRESASGALREGDVFRVGGTMWVYRVNTEGLVPDPTQAPASRRQLDRAEEYFRRSSVLILRTRCKQGARLVADQVHALSGRSGRVTVLQTPGNVGESSLLRTGTLPGKGTLYVDDIGFIPLGHQERLSTLFGHDPEAGRTLAGGAGRLILRTDKPIAYYRKLGLISADLAAHLARVEVLLPALGACPEAQAQCLRGVLAAAKHTQGIDPQALSALFAYDWPGGYRELTRVLKAATPCVSVVVVSPKPLTGRDEGMG